MFFVGSYFIFTWIVLQLVSKVKRTEGSAFERD